MSCSYYLLRTLEIVLCINKGVLNEAINGPLMSFLLVWGGRGREREREMVVSLNYCSQNGGNLYRAPYYNGNPNIGPRIIGNLDQYPDDHDDDDDDDDDG